MRFTTRMIAALVALLLHISTPAHAQIPCKYDVEIIPHVDCGIIGQGPMVLSAINNHGEVIGWATGCGEPGHYRSYTWNGGPTLTQLPIPPGSIGFQAADLSDNGLICGVGHFNISQNPPATLIRQRACVYNRNTNVWTIIPPTNLQVGKSEATACNNAGLVVGYRGIGDDSHGWPWNAFIFDTHTGIITDLGVMNGPHSAAAAISENGAVIGSTGTLWINSEDDRAFVHTNSVSTILDVVPTGFNSHAVAVNCVGQILVQGNIEQGSSVVNRTFLQTSSKQMCPLPLPVGFDRHLTAGAISESGLIAGTCSSMKDKSHYGFLWFGSEYAAVNSLVNPSAGVTSIATYLINDSRQLAGNGFLNSQSVDVRLTPRPPMVGDATCDDFVNVNDLLAVINSWGQCNGCHPDLDGNGIVNVWDLFIVVQNWGNSS